MHDIEQFFGGWFHQDWLLEADTAEEVVANFVRDGGLDRKDLKKLADAIQALSEKSCTNPELEEEIYQLGCCYMPSADGLPVKEWLRKVVERLMAASSAG